MKTDRKLLIVVLVVGFILGFVVGIAGGSRYQLKDSGVPGAVYKVDSWTGQTWLENGAQEFVSQPQGVSH